MKDRQIKNIAASVRQRLLNVAKDSGRPFQELLQYFAMERFLYRLTRTPHSDRFVLKGALMMTVWQASALRTRVVGSDCRCMRPADLEPPTAGTRGAQKLDTREQLVLGAASPDYSRFRE